MSDDPYGIEGIAEDDRQWNGSRYADVRDAVFANPYSKPYEIFQTSIWNLLRGVLPFGKPWQFLAAARRTVASEADLRWGPDRKGFRRLLHPCGVCLTGVWEITEQTDYSGYFRKGSRCLVIARYSSSTEPRRGHTRSLAMVGRLYPTTDPNDPRVLRSASFITQEDIGGAESTYINDAILCNAPNITVSERKWGAPAFVLVGIVLNIADKPNTIRQLYEIAELGKPPGEPTKAPEFLQFRVAPGAPKIPGDALDFRDEVLAHVHDSPQRKLTFSIETSDTGETHGPPWKVRRTITGWRQIGTLTFDAGVASYNGDHVFHANHPPWRRDRNDPSTAKHKRLS
ncbi:MAG TPA: hypothetical protein VG323_20860 [Thermoanaerobaculia bacterium]|nr:hypothetical protein [Thermoanaerobaculia bacterium]